MKKGIVHMLEAILVSLTFAMVVPLLLYPVASQTDWNYIQMSLNGQDILSTLDGIPDGGENYLQNIMEKDTKTINNFVTSEFSQLRTKKISYGIKTENSIKNEILIGFNCTTNCHLGSAEEEKKYIEDILNKAYINGRYIHFRVFPFSYENINRKKFDVIFIRGNQQRINANNKINIIREFTDKGVGIFGFYNISVVGNLEDEIFGLTVGAGTDGDLDFVNKKNVSKPNYEIQKMFYGTGLTKNFSVPVEIVLWGEKYLTRETPSNPNSIDIDNNTDGTYDITVSEGDFFELENPSGPNQIIKVDKINTTEKTYSMSFQRNNDYEFENLTEGCLLSPTSKRGISNVVIQTSDGKGGLIVNGTKNSFWRSAWMPNPGADDINALAKSSVIWVTQKEWWNVMRTVSDEFTKVGYFVSQGEEFHEPYWIEINLWNIY